MGPVHDFQFIRKQKSSASAGLFLFALLLGFAFTGIKTHEAQAKRGRELVAPPAGLEHFTFGFRNPMADLLWVRSIQDFDFCENLVRENLCRGRGWLFQTLDLVTTLDPEFRMAYSAGGMALSVIISDIEGASRLFDKGVEHFPKDWVILYKAAYHALNEEKNPAKAAGLMERAAQSGAPDWVYILAGRLYTDAGRRELAERILTEMQAIGLDEKVQDRLRAKLAEAPEKAAEK